MLSRNRQNLNGDNHIHAQFWLTSEDTILQNYYINTMVIHIQVIYMIINKYYSLDNNTYTLDSDLI